MNRRRFLSLGALAGMAPGPLSRVLRANTAESASRPAARPSSKFDLPILRQVISAPQTAFPTVTPQFAAMFRPGAGGIQLVRSETIADFYAQIQAQAANGFVLTSMTTIQNLNRTWFYAAFTKGANAGGFQLISTTDASSFQQSFTQYQSGYRLVDFNIAWQQGSLLYTGYWLPVATPVNQVATWDVIDYTPSLTGMAGKGMYLHRIQAYPHDAGALYSAIFTSGSGLWTYDDQPTESFDKSVTGANSGNSLVALAYNPASGNMIGYWQGKVNPSAFVMDQSWETLIAAAQQNAAAGTVLSSMTAYPNAPDFEDYFEANEAPSVMGYAYAVSRNGNVIANGSGYSRGAAQPNNPNTPYTPDTRQNIASSSKAITGMALQILILQNPSITLESPFWPLVQKMVPNPDASVKVVTLRNLAEMKSGMVQESGEGPLSPPDGGTDIWPFLVTYLSKPLTGTPGVTYYYDNTNFTILQGVIGQVSGMNYVDFVTKYVLEPLEVDTTIFNATSDPIQTATLGYSGSSDTRTGFYAGSQVFVAAGGWITNVREMIKPLMALRGTTLMPQAAATQMLTGLIGWDGSSVGNFGTYHYKNGGLNDGATPDQWLGSATVRLGEGYDVVMLCNSTQPTQPGTVGQLNIVNLVINAFESRGVPIASEPANAPYVTTVVHGASFLPNCAPGSYLSVIGGGFPGPEVAWDPTDDLPTELNGVQVLVGSQPAYIAYAGPGQINFLLPSTVPAGLQNVEVTMPAGGMQSSVQINPIAPGLFAYQLNGKSYPAALFAGTSEIVAAVGALSSPSRPATAGDFIELYGTGMGPTSPAAPDGVVFTTSYPASSLAAFEVTIGGVAAMVSFAGLVGPGLFQLDVQIPSGLSGGDQPVVLTVGGIAAQPNLMLTIAA